MKLPGDLMNFLKFHEITKLPMSFFHDFTELNKMFLVNLCNWLFRTSSTAQPFCSENHSWHGITNHCVWHCCHETSWLEQSLVGFNYDQFCHSFAGLHSDVMAPDTESKEESFSTRKIFKQHAQCKKYNLIPKLEYKILDEVKCAAANSTTKSEHDYYCLTK